MRSLEQSMPLKLLRAREAVMEHFRTHLHAAGVTEQQWRVLRCLAEAGEIDLGALARKACLLTPSLSRIVRDLKASGLIRRHVSKSDKRIVIVSLTARGRKLFGAMSEDSNRIYNDIEARIGLSRCARVMRDLDFLIAALTLENLDECKVEPPASSSRVKLENSGYAPV